jgi:hypothetical protein
LQSTAEERRAFSFTYLSDANEHDG